MLGTWQEQPLDPNRTLLPEGMRVESLIHNQTGIIVYVFRNNTRPYGICYDSDESYNTHWHDLTTIRPLGLCSVEELVTHSHPLIRAIGRQLLNERE